MRRHRVVALAMLLACAAPLALTVQSPPLLADEDGCGCWNLYQGLTADCDRRYQDYLNTCNGMDEPDRSHCYNGAAYWRDVCYQDAWWEFESCIRSCR